ncbi:hypothetical protein [Enterococcus sp. HY326]|uniref:hypothetical protein n=1 Tax=Enterococcus sp. HY326 TaxID=2971265 RepID=UPI002240D3B4|nr:hypothetical protein [Enterococcus sp. HY326]
MTKIILSGSITFQADFQHLAKSLQAQGYQVLNYPKETDNIVAEYPQIFKQFFRDIEAADIFYLYNKEKNGIPGYIGAAAFAEATYALGQKLLHQKPLQIILKEQPSPSVPCFAEIELWQQQNWLTVGEVNGEFGENKSSGSIQ